MSLFINWTFAQLYVTEGNSLRFNSLFTSVVSAELFHKHKKGKEIFKPLVVQEQDGQIQLCKNTNKKKKTSKRAQF